MNFTGTSLHILALVLLLGGTRKARCDPETKDSGLSRSSIKFVTETDTNASENTDNESHIYEVEDEGICVQYKFKPGVKCVQVKYDDSIIWKHDTNEHDAEYPRKIRLNTHTNNIWITLKGRLCIYTYRNGKWNLTFDYHVDPGSPSTSSTEISDFHLLRNHSPISDVKIITTKEEYPHSQRVNYLTESDLIHHGEDSIRYKFKGGYSSIEVKIKEETVFSLRKDSENKRPYLLYLSIAKQQIIIDFCANSSQFSYINDLFHFALNKVIFYFVLRKIPVTTDDGRQLTEVDELSKYIYQRVDGQVHLPHMIITIKTSDGVNKYSFLEYPPSFKSNSGKVLMFKFDKGSPCVELRHSDEIIWKHDPEENGGEYPLEIYFDYLIRAVVTIRFASRSFIYRYIFNEWSLISVYINRFEPSEPVNSANGLNSESPTTATS